MTTPSKPMSLMRRTEKLALASLLILFYFSLNDSRLAYNEKPTQMRYSSESNSASSNKAYQPLQGTLF